MVPLRRTSNKLVAVLRDIQQTANYWSAICDSCPLHFPLYRSHMVANAFAVDDMGNLGMQLICGSPRAAFAENRETISVESQEPITKYVSGHRRHKLELFLGLFLETLLQQLE